MCELFISWRSSVHTGIWYHSYVLCASSFVHRMAGVQKVSRRCGATSEVWVPEGWFSTCEMIHIFACKGKTVMIVSKMVGITLTI
jgi:hypothetical protein